MEAFLEEAFFQEACLQEAFFLVGLFGVTSENLVQRLSKLNTFDIRLVCLCTTNIGLLQSKEPFEKFVVVAGVSYTFLCLLKSRGTRTKALYYSMHESCIPAQVKQIHIRT